MRNANLSTERILAKLDEYFSKNDTAAAKNHLTYWLGEAELVGDTRAALLCKNELMGLCRKLGLREEACSYAERALALVEEMGISDNVGAATTYLNAATVYKAFGEASRALPLYEAAEQIYEKNLSPTDLRRAGLCNNMALALCELGRFEAAAERYQTALSILQKTAGTEPEQTVTQLNIATLLEAQWGLEAAAEQIEECLSAAKELLETEQKRDGNYAFVCEKCATVFGYYGHFAYQDELLARSRCIYEGT